MKPITVVVTGVGAPVGVSIIKSLRVCNLPIRIIGVDSEPLAQGLFRVDRAHLMPSARQNPDAYFEALVKISKIEGADILFSGWEGELAMLAERKAEFEERTHTTLPLIPNTTLKALDKWLTIEVLKVFGVPVPDTVLPTSRAQLKDFCSNHNYPYIVKPRRSSGGKGLVLVHTEAELAFFSHYISDLVVQEHLLPDDREYTVGVFIQSDGKPGGALALKRSLSGGLSYRMESDRNTDACDIAIQAAKAMGLIGAVNVQMRLTSTGFKVFEINPRFSSATCVRAHFGLNEPELTIRHFILGEEICPPEVKEGICLRFWEEMYFPIEVKNAAQQGEYQCRGQILSQF
ncbi:ATP-grasp domain-containing protein [Scytonema sp. UIC 10036]|uniref:ATP-grasp domain-containing protein n=1 Tax=Scytonema sp. UIC 10036 TaxID=2304196 RepID=UPI0012DACCD8|nr:ATP-grasp domain-containing protein [Scytonema sp. UIC 10036]MUG92458.1 ATP-grasp domain-containing protein [Scytonema sp. UIC 10036]